ncbi:hypothetical protein HYG86_09210 [Alkalicella caledoniensis]|uniref:Uncharacterized protein n=1 Tax=Alkalicella caledoniensis TaxID=2731377 RepID=A0A7G9W8C7_ALKCA|nr:hypothetical protein [Alkalicella caledoniensis]QNO14939.1 hypothetical protein HYG86_09210 [Alkalicella caledoniensis]
MEVKCIKELSVPMCDDDGLHLDNGETYVVEQGTEWEVIEDKVRYIVGGEIRLESGSGWVEISEDTFKEHFEPAK